MKKTNNKSNDDYQFGAHYLSFYPLDKIERDKMRKMHLSMKDFVCPRCYCFRALQGACGANWEPKCFGRSDRKIGFFNF